MRHGPLGTPATLFDDGCPDENHDLTEPVTQTNDKGSEIAFQECRICGLNVTTHRTKEAT